MSVLEIFLIALSLAMDAFAVSVTNGITVQHFKWSHSLKQGVYFGLFQFLMPVFGFWLGSSFKVYIERLDHWIAFFLLTFIGGKMIWDTIKELRRPTCECCEEGAKPVKSAREVLTPRLLTVQAIATSIDALAVGISFAVLDEINIWTASAVIGAVALILSFLGGMLGKKIGCFLKDKAQLLGGAVLILIGIKILAEHLMGKG